MDFIRECQLLVCGHECLVTVTGHKCFIHVEKHGFAVHHGVIKTVEIKTARFARYLERQGLLERYTYDVAIKGDKIEALGDSGEATAALEINVKGMAVAPDKLLTMSEE